MGSVEILNKGKAEDLVAPIAKRTGLLAHDADRNPILHAAEKRPVGVEVHVRETSPSFGRITERPRPIREVAGLLVRVDATERLSDPEGVRGASGFVDPLLRLETPDQSPQSLAVDHRPVVRPQPEELSTKLLV